MAKDSEQPDKPQEDKQHKSLKDRLSPNGTKPKPGKHRRK